MRPIHISYTPLDDSNTYFKAGNTGAGPFTMTTTTCSDGLAHNVALTSAANLSAINMTLTGTNADGYAQTEVVAGPNANTVYSTKFFRTLTTVTAASTLGANTMDVGIKDVSVSPTIPINRLQSSFSCTPAVEVTGTINYTVQYTISEIYPPSPDTTPTTPTAATWVSITALTSKTTSLDSTITSPVVALRLLINSLTAGATVVFSSIQTRG